MLIFKELGIKITHFIFLLFLSFLISIFWSLELNIILTYWDIIIVEVITILVIVVFNEVMKNE
jgi:hypothetical protein